MVIGRRVRTLKGVCSLSNLPRKGLHYARPSDGIPLLSKCLFLAIFYFLKIFLFCFILWMICLHMCLWTMHVPCAHRSQKRVRFPATRAPDDCKTLWIQRIKPRLSGEVVNNYLSDPLSTTPVSSEMASRVSARMLSIELNFAWLSSCCRFGKSVQSQGSQGCLS